MKFILIPLKGLADTRFSDLDTWTLKQYWTLSEIRGPDITVNLKLDNGDPLIVERRVGQGRVMLTGFPLDTKSGNLVSRQAYVPFLHSLVYALAEPASPELNLAAGPNVALSLSPSLAGNPMAQKTTGLRGDYFDKAISGTRPNAVRIDPAIDFTFSTWPGKTQDKVQRWERESLGVRWTGSLLPRKTGPHFLSFEGGDMVSSVWIEGNLLLSGNRKRRMPVDLVAGKRVDIRVEYRGYRDEKAKLFWTEPGQAEELIPTQCLYPSRGDTAMAELNELLTVIDPLGREREITAEMKNGLVVLSVAGRSVPGLYRVKTTYTLRNVLGDLIDEDGNLPFSVHTGIEESGIDALPGPAVVVLRQFVDLMEASSTKDVIMALSGRRFGQELWRILAWGALILIVAEIGLASWIAWNRRAGQWKRVAFDDAAAAAAALDKQS